MIFRRKKNGKREILVTKVHKYAPGDDFNELYGEEYTPSIGVVYTSLIIDLKWPDPLGLF